MHVNDCKCIKSRWFPDGAKWTRITNSETWHQSGGFKVEGFRTCRSFLWHVITGLGTPWYRHNMRLTCVTWVISVQAWLWRATWVLFHLLFISSNSDSSLIDTMLKFIADGEASIRTGKERTAHHVTGTRCIPACSGQREFDDLKTRRLPEKALIQFADTMTENGMLKLKTVKYCVHSL